MTLKVLGMILMIPGFQHSIKVKFQILTSKRSREMSTGDKTRRGTYTCSIFQYFARGQNKNILC